MATRKKADTSVNGIPHPSPETPLDEPIPIDPLDAKFTYNARTETESLTIRTNSERELEELIARWKFRIVPKREPKPKMNEGEPCQSCNGFMTLQIGTNRKTHKEYEYLSCSNWPNCNMTAYVAKQPEQEQIPA